MAGHELIKRLRRLAKERGWRFELDEGRGKGSHAVLFVGERRTTIRNRADELKAGTLAGMLRQLGLSKEDL